MKALGNDYEYQRGFLLVSTEKSLINRNLYDTLVLQTK